MKLIITKKEAKRLQEAAKRPSQARAAHTYRSQRRSRGVTKFPAPRHCTTGGWVG